MNKKVMIPCTCAIAAVGVLVGAAAWTHFNNQIKYGIYAADAVNGQDSYIMLDDEHISFTNVDFETAEFQEAVRIAMNEQMENSAETEHDENEEHEENLDVKHEDFMKRAEEIQKMLDFESIFNGNTFDATEIEDTDDGLKELTVYDSNTDTELYLVISPNEHTLQCGDVIMTYQGTKK